MTAANSRISDADMADAVIAHTTNNILRQAGIAMLAHAIQQPRGMLELINQGNILTNFKV
jgi:flagellin